MSVDLGGYSLRLRKALRRGGYACVYIATLDPGSCRIGYAIDLNEAIARLRRANNRWVEVEEICWCPDRSIAGQIADELRDDFASLSLGDGWFKVGVDEAVSCLRDAACRRLSEWTLVFHENLMAGKNSQIFKKTA